MNDAPPDRADRTYFVQTFGCQQNENDSEIIAGHLEALGYSPGVSVETADVVVFNTCSVREHADTRFFGQLGRMKPVKKRRPDVFIAVCGCVLMQPAKQEMIRRSFPFVNLVFGTGDLNRFPDLFKHAQQMSKTLVDVGEATEVVGDLPVRRAKRHRALISVMSGCNNFCTYCIVPYTRGRERSRRRCDIVRDAERARDQGYKEIMLLGQNVNAYGNAEGHIDGDFADVLSDVASRDGLFVVRFMTSHPKDMSPRLIEAIGSNPIVEPHVHLPLQSGSDRILKAMNRHYDVATYKKRVSDLRRARPGLALSTDIIVGFPGETDEDFQATLDVVNEVSFDAAFTFLYSPREGTPAAKRTDQVPRDLALERYQRLTDLVYAQARRANEAYIGQQVDVLITGPSATRQDILSGRTRDNRLVHITRPKMSYPPDMNGDCGVDPASIDMTNCVCQVAIKSAGSFALEGELVSHD